MTDLDQRKVWVQRDGTPIRIKDMGDQHLHNTIELLKRGAGFYQHRYFGQFWGAPDDVFDMALRDMGEDPWEWLRRQPLVKALRQERKRRRAAAADSPAPCTNDCGACGTGGCAHHKSGPR